MCTTLSLVISNSIVNCKGFSKITTSSSSSVPPTSSPPPKLTPTSGIVNLSFLQFTRLHSAVFNYFVLYRSLSPSLPLCYATESVKNLMSFYARSAMKKSWPEWAYWIHQCTGSTKVTYEVTLTIYIYWQQRKTSINILKVHGIMSHQCCHWNLQSWSNKANKHLFFQRNFHYLWV